MKNKRTPLVLSLTFVLAVLAIVYFLQPPRKGGETAAESTTQTRDLKPVVDKQDDTLTKEKEVWIAAINGRNGETYRERMLALENFDDSLGDTEEALLLEFIQNASQPLANGTSINIEAAVRNNVMNLLKRETKNPQALTDAFIGIYRDKTNQHPVLRDYAIQHLASWHNKLEADKPLDGQALDRELNQIEDIFWTALDETQAAIPATALLALNRITPPENQEKRQTLHEEALNLIEKNGIGEAVQSTALQLAAQAKPEEALRLAEKLIRVGKSVALRRSAIATIGNHGNEQSVQMLRELTMDDESPFPRQRNTRLRK